MTPRNTTKFFLACTSLLFAFLSFGQTLIINEVSNGPAGSQEYVEFVVVDVTATYDCSGSAPPCIDIRGWIFDDNSGYHNATGVAAGAARFSNDPIWSCVPLGTIIVIYNDADPNTSITAADVDMNDGNCALVVPLNDPQYFEFTNTTPGDVSCSYPTTGWGTDTSPTWTSNTAFANSGDCARLVDLNGCEVFSLCYGSASANPLIYFSGSGTDDVWYFNDGDPFLQSNWSEGCAGDIAACGSNDQTPGAPNNAANAAYIAQFNNGCTPIPPIVASATSTSGCGCTGTGTASATGSIPGYTYEWFDDTFTPIGQSTATATGLCSGTYNAIVTSSIGCEDTVQITITATGAGDPGTNGTLSVCSTSGSENLFDYLGGTPAATGTWAGPSATSGGNLGTIDPATASSGVYTYTIGTAPCTATATVTLTITSSPNSGTIGTLSVCSTSGSENLFDYLGGTPDATGTWTGPSASSGGNLGTIDPASASSGTYTYTVGTAPCAVNTDVVVTIIQHDIDPIANITTCGGYMLPAITGTNLSGNQAYYTGPGGTGTQYLAGQVITSDITLYAFDQITSGITCSDEETFIVNISNIVIDLGSDTTLCAGETILLDAGTGVDSYLWQDGSTNQTYNVTTSGTYWCEVQTLGSNQIQNGDFSLGDNFFTSDYVVGAGGAFGPLSTEGTYFVTTNANIAHINFSNCSDHTSGSGQMLVANGAGTPGSNVWCQTVTVIPNTDYLFSAWISNALNDPNVAILQFSIDGTAIGNTFTTSATGCLWQQFSTTWNSGASTSVDICVVNQNTSIGGNDFLLDDLYFAPYCTNADTVNVTVLQPMSLTINPVTLNCNGDCDGQATVSVTGGSGSFSYSWDNATTDATATTLSNLCAGTYNVIVSENSNTNCTETESVTVAEPTTLTTISTASNEHCGQADGSVSSAANGGTLPYTYNWYSDAGLTTLVGSGTNVSNLSAGDYYLELIDDNGCTIYDNVTINDLAGPTVSALVNADATTSVSCDGEATASVTGGTGTIDFLWDNGNTNANATDLCVGNHCITVTDDFGCTDVACITISSITGITLTLTGVDPSCNDLCDGTIDATVTNAAAPITYAWTHGPITEDLTGMCSGSYELTVTDGIGETATATITLSNPDTISVQTNTYSQVSCNGVCDGEIIIASAGGTGTLNVTWTDATPAIVGTTNTLSSLCAGTYDLNILDANGCSFDSTYVIDQPTQLSSITSSANSNCGATDGSVSVIASGGVILIDYSYSWTDANNTIVGTSDNVNGLAAGNYYVSISDDNGCSLIDSVVINDFIPNITITEDSSAVSCYGLSDGTIDLTISSPNAYTIDWTGPNGFVSTLENLTNLETGSYNYVFTDIVGCSTSGEVIIDEPLELILTLSLDSTTCDVACDGSITAAASGGVSPYTFSSSFPGWTNGTADLCIGNYTITLTDASGCFVSIDTLLNHDDDRPDPSILLTDFDYCLDEGPITIPVQTAGGSWATNGTGLTDAVNGIFDPASAGVGSEQLIYSFSGVCGDEDTVTVNIFQPEDASFGLINSVCENDAPVSLTPDNLGGIWTGIGVNGTSLTFDPAISGPGTFEITYIIAGQCPDTVINQITVNAVQNPVITPINPLCLDEGNVQLNVSIAGGIWSGVSNSSGIVNTNTLGEGTFEVYYTIQGQCGESDTLEITVNGLPSLDISVDDTLGCAPLLVSFNDLNEIIGNTYSWSLDGTEISTASSDSFTLTEEGCVELSATVVDNNGCSTSITFPTPICAEAFPVAYFEYTPENPTTYDYLVDVSNLSTDASNYNWTLDGVVISSNVDLNLNFNGYLPDGYLLCLTGTNYLGCSDTYCDTIYLEEEFAIFVPNTFTPNGNGTNETFGPVYSGEQPEEISFMIFNRWGQLIFEVENFDEFWDGTYLGQSSPEDVYVWKLKYKLPNSTKRETLIGHVNLIR